MTQFRYRAISAAGETLTGRMEATSVADVVARLQDQGHTPLEAVAAEGAASSGSFAGAPVTATPEVPISVDVNPVPVAA